MNKGHNVGLEALKKVSSITTDISSYHIGFLLGPRINAAGRLDNPRAALNLLMADQISEANILAKRLDEVNGERQLVEAEIVEDALERVSKAFNPDTDYCIVVGEEGWHPGVVGIVASRLVQRFQRPCVVIGFNKEGIGKGSCRSIGPFDLVEHLQKTSDHLIKYGGHQMAAGLEMSRDNFDAFREAFSKVARETLEGQDLRPVLKVDGWIEWVDVTNDLMAWSQRMEPFGLSNARPIWAVAGIEIVGTPQVVGKKHLKFSVAMGNKCLDVIAFGMGDREIPDGPIDLAFQVNNNNFRGVDSMQLQVQDFRLSVKEPI